MIDRVRGSPAARLAFWLAGAITLGFALWPHPIPLPGEPSDKVQHMIAFAIMGVLGAFAFPRISAVRLLLMLSLFGALIELLQAIPVLNRDSDPLDWIADTAACAIVLLPFLWWTKRLR